MAIDVECRGCNARYRVNDELAGRMAECKHCGQKFRVPYRSAVVRLGDEEEMAAPVNPQLKPAPAKAKRDFAEYGLDPNDPTAPIGKPKRERPKVQQGILPDLVADLWLPLGLMIVCYGIALYTAAGHMLRSNGPLAGMILLGIVVAMFFALVIPMTMRMIEGASKTLDFEAPNAIWLQTAGSVALPTMGMVVGFFGGGSIAGLIAGGLIGFTVMVPLMALMFRIDFLKGIQAAVLGAMFYVLSLAGTGAVIAAVGLWLMPMWKLTRPWDEAPPPTEVATNTNGAAVTTPAVAKHDDPAPTPVALALTTPDPSVSPAPDSAAAPAKPAKPVEPWDVATDPWAGPDRWPGDVHYVLHVRPPVNVLHTAPHEPYVALVDQEALKVFDLRSGKRIGLINERPRERAAAISKDGAFIAFEVVMPSGAVPPSIEVWSVTDGKMILRVPSYGRVRALGFDPSGRVYVLNTDAGKRVVQGWDVRTRRQASSTHIEEEGALAVSANARLLASVRPGQLRVYDLQDAKLVGQRAIEPGFRQIGPVAFSPNGIKLAAVVVGDPNGAPRVLVWDVKDGSMAAPMQVAAAGPGDLERFDLQWLPDGEGFLANGQMIDHGTSRTIYAPQPPAVGGSVGRVRMALSNFRVLYEIPPTPATERLIYRIVSFPRAELMASLKSIRGEDWEPPADRDSSAALAVASAAPEATTQRAAPATRPTNPAAMKEWVVSILTITAPDGLSIERQLKTEREKLRPLEQTHFAAEARADALAGDYILVPDGAGGNKKQRRYSAREISDAKGAAKKALEDVRDVKADIARLERELKAVATTRVVTGTLGDGIPVTINVDGASLVALVDPLTSGSKIKVTGGPRFAGGTLEIKLRTITPIE